MIAFTQEIRDEYQMLWDTCTINPGKQPIIDAIVKLMREDYSRYYDVEKRTHVPAHVIAIIHLLECGRDFTKHLHNGDPLTARTVHVPKGYPIKPDPPYMWEYSAADALTQNGMTQWNDWTVAGMLYRFERYNGFGYRGHDIHSPYLWSGTSHYTRGKYVADGKWDATAVSKQIGAAAIMKGLGL